MGSGKVLDYVPLRRECGAPAPPDHTPHPTSPDPPTPLPTGTTSLLINYSFFNPHNGAVRIGHFDFFIKKWGDKKKGQK
jgi:hypothetical protein